MRKLSVGILMGGPSAEHEISLLSGKAFLSNLNPDRYIAYPILISKNGGWFLRGKRIPPEEALRHIDVALLALHGEFGEDGRLQAFLEHHGVSYTGSAVVSSALGMDKLASRSIFRADGLRVPATAAFDKDEIGQNSKLSQKRIFQLCGKGPWMVKPKSRGSSVGVSFVRTPSAFSGAFKKAFRFESQLLVEEYLGGTEVTVPILERNGKPEVLPLVEIRPRKSLFFDYKEKYGGEDGAEEIIPARISRRIAVLAAEAGLAAYKLLACRGYARVDMILVHDRPYVLEANTLPGMAPVSLFPKAAKAAGVEFPGLLDILIENALRKGGE
ncbi:MAG: D-alanine--D-alanine ligase [Candidatus Sungbacteria bacterium]|nr:D-alanine--D-alanine ligase [Candidatus Sungbacteria bacterium]